VATSNASGARIYHVSNSNWADGVGLDAVVDALEEAGCVVSTLPYREWFARFKDALGALPDDERRRTPLAVIGRWEHPASDGARLDTRAFGEALAASTPWSTIPSLGPSYLVETVRAIASW
jgi:hypothetical protein